MGNFPAERLFAVVIEGRAVVVEIEYTLTFLFLERTAEIEIIGDSQLD